MEAMRGCQSSASLVARKKKKRKGRKKEEQQQKGWLKAKELGWTSTGSAQDRIPEYDAARDPFCHVLHNKRSRKMNRLEKLRSCQVKLDLREDSQHEELDDGCPVLPHIWELQRSLTEEIMVREQLVESVRKQINEPCLEISRLLESLTRVKEVGLSIVEGVTRWREVCDKPDRVFLYRGRNYLLCLLSDLNFLADSKAVVDSLSLDRETMRNNPFMSPYSLLVENKSGYYKGGNNRPLEAQSDKAKKQGQEEEEQEEEEEEKAEAQETSKVEEPEPQPKQLPSTINYENIDDRIAAAEQVLIKEIRKNDIRAIFSYGGKIKSPKATLPCSPDHAKIIPDSIDDWRFSSKDQMKELAKNWGLPRTFSELKWIQSNGSQGEEQEEREGEESGKARPSTTSSSKVKQKTIKIIYSHNAVPQPSLVPYHKKEAKKSKRKRRPHTAAALASSSAQEERHGEELQQDRLSISNPKYSFCRRPPSRRYEPQDHELTASGLYQLGQVNKPCTTLVLVVTASLIVLSPQIPSLLRWQVLRESLLTGQGQAMFYSIRDFNSKKISAKKLQALIPFITDPRFEPMVVNDKTGLRGAGALCAWVINTVSSQKKYRALVRKHCDFSPPESVQPARPKTEDRAIAAKRKEKQRAKVAQAEQAKAAPTTPPKEQAPDSEEQERKQIVPGELVYTATLERPNGTFVISFLKQLDGEGMVIKCYSPRTSQECHTNLTAKERTQIEQRLHLPTSRNLNELKLLAKALKAKLSVSNAAGALQIHVDGITPEPGDKWNKIYGTTRTFEKRVYSISVFVDRHQKITDTDFLFKARDAKSGAGQAVYRLGRPEASAILFYAKHLLSTQIVSSVVDALLNHMRVTADKNGSSTPVISFTRLKKPLHNPHGLDHPEDPELELNLHDPELFSSLVKPEKKQATPLSKSRPVTTPGKIRNKNLSPAKSPIKSKAPSSPKKKSRGLSPTPQKIKVKKPQISAKPKTAGPAKKQEAKNEPQPKTSSPSKSKPEEEPNKREQKKAEEDEYKDDDFDDEDDEVDEYDDGFEKEDDDGDGAEANYDDAFEPEEDVQDQFEEVKIVSAEEDPFPKKPSDIDDIVSDSSDGDDNYDDIFEDIEKDKSEEIEEDEAYDYDDFDDVEEEILLDGEVKKK